MGVMALLTVGAPRVLRAETLADAIALAYQSNPTLQAQRAQQRALDETYVQARAGWRPTASAQVTGDYSKAPEGDLFGGVSQVENNSGQALLSVTQPIYTGGRTAAEVRATEADVLAGRQSLRGAEATLLQNVVNVYADVLRDQALLTIHEHDVAVLQSEVDDSLARFRAGEVTTTDVAQTRTQLAQSRSALTQAQGSLQLSRANYAAVVGQNPGRLQAALDMPGVPADVDKAFDTATQENPGLRQAEIAEEASRARVAEARAADRPTVGVNASLGYAGQLTPFRGPDYDRAVSAMVTIAQPLFTGGVNASNIRRALELNTSDRIGIEAARRAAVLAVSQAWNQLATERATVISELDHVQVARDYFSGTQAEYTVGQRSTLDIVIAEQSLVAAEATLTEAQHDAFVAQAALLSAMGRLEVRYIVPDAPLYDPATSFRRVARDGALPWEGLIAAIDNLGAPGPGGYRPIAAPQADLVPTIAAASPTAPELPAPRHRASDRALGRHHEPLHARDAWRPGRRPAGRHRLAGPPPMSAIPMRPAVASQSLEPSPLREALRLCGVHLRYAMLFSALVNLAYLAPTFYMLGVYDMVVPSGSELTLVFVTLALSLTLLTLTFLDKLRSRILSAASIRLDNVFAGRIFRRLMLNAQGAPTARLNQVMREFDMVRAAATGPAALAAFDAPWIPIYVAVCFYLHPAIGALACGGSLVLFGLAVWNERSTRLYSQRALEASAASFAAQEAAASAADVVGALGMTHAFVNKFEAARRRANLPQMEAARASGRISGLIRFLRLFLQSAALGLGAWLAIHKQISGGAIFAASMLCGRALGPIDQIVAQWRTVSQAISAYGAIRTHVASQQTPAPTALPAPAARLSVSNLMVASPERDRLILQGLSFAAGPGQVVGIVGPSGAGKTTLMQVLANARAADQGEVCIDGARYGDWDSQRLGRFIGYLPQDCVLFPGSVKDNISRFDVAAGEDVALVDSKAVAAAKKAGVHDMILALPGGYDTELGPRGRGLSAGQQQRIALARALYGDPVLYLFDEPNSNLDGEGEAALLQVIAQLKGDGALVILSAHRSGLIAAADLLAVIRDGRLERFGPRQNVVDALKPITASKPAPVIPRAAPAGARK